MMACFHAAEINLMALNLNIWFSVVLIEEIAVRPTKAKTV